MRRLLQFLLFLLPALQLCAQQQHEQTNAGTDFWVTSVHVLCQSEDIIGAQQSYNDMDSLYAYLYIQLTQQNAYNIHDTAVIQVVGTNYCNGYASNPATGWIVNFQVLPETVTEIKIPAEEILCFPTSGIYRKGIHIHTEGEVWAYLISNRNTFSIQQDSLGEFYRCFSKFQLIPVQVYDSEYYIPNYIMDLNVREGGLLSYFIVATEDSTVVFIPEHFEYHGIHYEFGDETFIPAQSHLLNSGDVLSISGIVPHTSLSQYTYMPIHTDCKPVSVYYYLFHANPEEVGNLAPYISNFGCYNPHLSGHDYVFLSSLNNYLLFSSTCVENLEWQSSTNTIVENASEDDAGIWVEVHNGIQWPYPIHFFTINHAPPISTLYSNPWRQFLWVSSVGHTTLPYAPVDRRVREVMIPTLRDPRAEYVQTTLTIAVPPEGISSTQVNGSPIPASAFQTDPVCSDRCFATMLEYENNEIPPLFHITNPFGFSANLEEGAIASINNGGVKYFSVCGGGAGCTYFDDSISSDTLNACIGDTLHMESQLDCDAHAPIYWVVNGTEYRQDELFLPIEVADTLTVLMIEEKFCRPDTSRTIVLTPGIPHITLPADTTICRGASVTAQSDLPGFWRWNDGTTSATFTPQTEGDYTVSISNECGFRSATIQVRFYDDPLYVDFGNDTLLCELATLLLDATQQHPANYLWQDFSTNATYTVINDGRYWVVVTDGCTGVSDTIDVTYLYDLQIDLGPDTAVCSDRPYTLDATTPYSHYLWHDGTTAPTHEVTTSGTYSVHVYNACTEADASVTIEVEECEEVVHVPNAFTPNGDGQNDLLLPVFNHPERLESYNLHIYDRWGRLLFSTDNPHQGWNCSECPAGVYVWRMEYKAASEGSKILTGSVTVVR